MSEDFPAHLAGFRPGSVLAGYRLEAHVAAGGMGVVFRARDVRLGRQVALKILAPALAADPTFRRRFIAESRAAAVVDDPHIIPVYEADEADGVLFIAMRFVAGGDLRRVLEREGVLAPDRAAEFISPVASALDAAHAAGLVHRDVKPGNVLVDARAGRPDHVYLSDFGASKGAMTSVSLTGQGFLGTPDYAAPEQVSGVAVDGRADEYALACVAFRLLAGTPPFERDHGMAVLLAHLSAPPPSLTARRPDLPGAADAILAKAMAKTADDRYGSCGEFADALREALGVASYHPRSTTAASAQPQPLATVPTEISSPEAGGDGKPAALPAPAGTVTMGPPGNGRGAAEMPVAVADSGVDSAGRDGSDDAGLAERTATVVAHVPDGTRPAATAATGKTIWLRRRRLPAIALGCAIAVAAGVIPFVLTSTANTPKPGNSPKPTSAATASSGSRPVIAAGSGSRPIILEDPGSTAAVAFSPGGTTLAVADRNGSTYVWDVATRSILATLTDPGSEGVDSVAFSPGGTTLAVGDYDGSTYVWDVATRSILDTLTDPSGSGVSAVAFGSNGTLATGDDYGYAYLWDIAARTTSDTLPDPGSQGVDSVAFSPGGTTLAVGDGNGSTYLWDVTTGAISATFNDPAFGGVDSVAFSPSGTTLAVGEDDGSTYLWDIATQTISDTLPDPGSDGITSVAFAPDGTTLAVADRNSSTYLWDVAHYTG